MAETIKSFVDKLQADGVKAGEKAAEKIRAEADAQARKIVDQAEQQAKQILSDAETERKNVHARTATELDLAARDTVLRLQDALTRALRGLLVDSVQTKLTDTEFVGKLLHDIVMQYVRGDAAGKGDITINVPDDMKHQLTASTLQALQKDLEGTQSTINLRGTLRQAGLEYSISDGTVEVTAESVVAVLSELLGPEVRKTLNRAMQEGTEANGDK